MDDISSDDLSFSRSRETKSRNKKESNRGEPWTGSQGNGKPVVPSLWITVVELAYIYMFPITIGFLSLVFMGAIMTGVDFFAYLAGVSLIIGLVANLVISISAAVGVYLDAKSVKLARSVRWNPSPAVFGALGVLAIFVPLAGLGILHYIYKRHRMTDMSGSSSGWWLGVALYTVFAAVAVMFIIAGISTMMMALLLIVASISVAPICLYRDASYVSAKNLRWSPNPVNYHLGVMISSITLLIPALVTGYYLYKRKLEGVV